LSHGYGAVLSIAGTRRLLASAVVARLPLGMASLAILLLVREHSGSFGQAGLTVGIFALAQAAVSPVQGALADRIGPGRVLVPCAVVQSAVLAGIVVAARADAAPVVIGALAALAGAFLPPVAACLRALWPEVVRDPGDREAAYALDAVVQETIWITGPLAVGALVAVGSPEAAVLLCAAVTLLGTLAFVTTPLARGRRGVPGRRAPGGALRSRGLRVVLLSALLVGAGIGAVEVGLPALAYHAGSGRAAGVMLSFWSIGSLAGGLWYGSRRWRRPGAARYPWLLVAIALSNAPLLAAHSVAAGIALSALAGIAYAPTMACLLGLVGELAPEGTVTEAFTWANAALGGGIAGGAAVAGALTETAGPMAPFVLGCTGAALGAALVFSSPGRFVRRAPALPSESPAGD
jgi:MFS family permease